MKPVSLPCPSSRPRTDPAKRRHQLELPVPWGDGQWPVRGTVQGGLFLLPLQQGGCQGVGLCEPVLGHAGVHAEVPRPVPQEEEEEQPADPLQEAASEASATKEAAA